ncbi:hypothetical protein [Streptomyces sp. NPDC001307]|uniref:hypothetical protein n=1 Tax=Streptomyces sp. NPDC001307 TaxID=3364560 RepID=UPI0036CED8C5
MRHISLENGAGVAELGEVGGALLGGLEFGPGVEGGAGFVADGAVRFGALDGFGAVVAGRRRVARGPRPSGR